MATRDELISFLDELLDAQAFDDYGPNGLQVLGRDDVGRVVTGVSAHRELFTRAAERGADLVLVHHGILWGSAPAIVDRRMKGRLAALFDADMSLAAYHLPLDAHPDVGNNALICRALGLRRGDPFAESRGRPIGWIGEAGDSIGLDPLVERCSGVFGRPPLVFAGDGRPLRRIGVVSGGGGSSLADAIRLGLDAFLTGEPEEPAMADAAESGVAFLACGHYATETLGVRRLGDLLAERFDVEHEFMEIPNPV